VLGGFRLDKQRINAALHIAQGATAYTYDANGNLAQKVEPGVAWVYAWNAENQLTSVTKNGVVSAVFGYDPLGRRAKKVAPASSTRYTYDGDDILIERRSSDDILMWIHGPGTDEPLASQNQAPGFTDNWKYRHVDGLGSLVTTVKSNAIISTVDYDAFGNGGTVTGYGFTGREYDPETGFLYYRARYYDPRAGRFISEDPLRWLAGSNMYAYVDSRPTGGVDPFGLQEIDSSFSNEQARALAGAISNLSHRLHDTPCCSKPDRDPMELFGLLRLSHITYDPHLRAPNPAKSGALDTPRGAVMMPTDYYRYRIRLTDRAFLKDCPLEHVILHELVHLTARSVPVAGGQSQSGGEADAGAVADRCYPCSIK
jgi:RHS repeat-associated protein